MLRRYRVVIAKPGLDGHDRGAKVIARALRDAGFEVIYTGLFQTPEQVAEAALQEDADAVGLSLLSGAHMTLIPQDRRRAASPRPRRRLVFAGGIIPPDDIATLKAHGVAEVFTPGSPLSAITDWLESALDSREQPVGAIASHPHARSPGEPVDLFEYQGKQLFARYGIPVSAGEVAETVDDAVAAAERVGLPGRRQGAGAGGRARQGRRHQARRRTPTRCARTPGNILGLDIKGHVVQRRVGRARVRHRRGVLRVVHARPRREAAPRHAVARRAASRSRQVAEENPDAIARIHVDPVDGLERSAVPRVGRGRRS